MMDNVTAYIDSDNDGTPNVCEDPDIDGIWGDEDNCPDNYNPDQIDTDWDGSGDVCDSTYGGPVESVLYLLLY
jgi:hypothetical protein